jgi:hypothetical protein
MLLIVTTLVVTVILIIIIYRQKQDEIINVQNQDKPSCLKDTAEKPKIPDPKTSCLYYPINRQCIVTDTVLKDDCCVLDLPPELSKTDAYKRMGMQLAAVAITGYLADEILTLPISALNFADKIDNAVKLADKAAEAEKLASTKAAKASKTKKAADVADAADAAKDAAKASNAAKAARVGKTGASPLGKYFTRMIQKLMAKRASQLAVKMSAKMSKAANAFAAISAALDIADPNGYSTFISNKYLIDMRDTVEYYMQTSAAENNSNYPMMFDIRWAFGDVYDQAYMQYVDLFTFSAGKDLLGCLPNITSEIVKESYVEIVLLAIDYANKDPIARDTFIYEKMVYQNPTISQYIGLYTEQSNEDNSGISLSQEGTEYWNALDRGAKIEHIKRATFFGDPAYDESKAKSIIEFLDNLLVSYTKYYRKHEQENGCREPHKEIIDYIMGFGLEFMSLTNPDYGKECIPRMTTFELSKPIPMMMTNMIYKICMEGGPHFVPGVPQCDKKTPEEYGVEFNSDRNLCRYSRQYCDRMALDYNSTTEDCDWYPGQEAVELFSPTGTSITRNIMKYGTGIKSCDNEEVVKKYNSVHDCRIQHIYAINDVSEKADNVKKCNENWKESGYRTKESCDFARGGTLVASAVPFLGVAGGDCSEAVFSTFVNEAYDLGEGVNDFFTEGDTTYFEDKLEESTISAMENRAKAVKDIFTGKANNQSKATAVTGSNDPNDFRNVAIKGYFDKGDKRAEDNKDFFTGEADYEDWKTYVNIGKQFTSFGSFL